MRRFILVNAVSGLILMSGCGTGNQIAPTVTGRWVRSSNVPGSSLNMTLQQNGNQVTGAGSYAIEAGRSGTLQVNGTASSTKASLTITYDTGATATFMGQRTDATHLSGPFQTQGFPSDTTTFVKQ